jgi:D-alanyl-lipoteichoic acid acyltransferase DltB (MBOAT superfamily)
MLFPTVAFAVFFVVVFTANWLLRPYHTVWRVFMIAASFYFYCYWDWRFGFLLGGSAIVNWALGRAIAARMEQADDPEASSGSVATDTLVATRASKVLVRLAVVVNLAVLGFFKYWEFFISSIRQTLDATGLPIDPPFLEIILPIGISFTTFHAISYVVDVGRGKQQPLSLLDFTPYLSFFPHLVAGPIVRATEFAPQISHRPDPRKVKSAEAFWLIFAGLFKKVVISTYLAGQIVDPVFAVPSEHNSLEVLFAIYGYAIQIYADFSGYTDIAIGCALLLGFRFPQNFDAPYIAESMQDFWRRWHITLSRWLRDYLYIPLGGNRQGPGRTSFNLMATMVLGGLWHGPAWNFVIWGAIHGTALVVERRVKAAWKPIGLPHGLVRVLQWALTFHVVCLAWVFFRAEDLDLALEMLGQLVGGLGVVADPSLVTNVVVLVVVASIASQFVPDRTVTGWKTSYSRLNPLLQGVAFGVGLLLVDAFGPEGVAPFIYFQF